MHVRDRHENEHTALKWLGGQFTGPKKGWRCSMDCISKVYHYGHQNLKKTKLKIEIHLYLSDFYHQKIKKYVTLGLNSQKFYVGFLCNPMEPFISGVCPEFFMLSWTFNFFEIQNAKGLTVSDQLMFK